MASKSVFGFSNTAEGFESMLDWSTKLAAANDKKQIVLGCVMQKICFWLYFLCKNFIKIFYLFKTVFAIIRKAIVKKVKIL